MKLTDRYETETIQNPEALVYEYKKELLRWHILKVYLASYLFSKLPIEYSCELFLL